MTKEQLLQNLRTIRGYKIKTRFGYAKTIERLYPQDDRLGVKLIKQDLTIYLDLDDIIRCNIDGGINEDDFTDLTLTVDLTDGGLRYRW